MDDIVVDVSDVAAGGDGLARADDGRVVLVRGGVPGDRVRARVEEEKRRMLRASVSEVIVPSADRVEPPCPHVARGCGGCGWQHVAVAAQPGWKCRVAEEALRRIGRIDGRVTPGPPLPTEGFRTTVRCLVVDGRVAFRAARSHDPVPVDRCLVAHPALQDLMARARFGDAREVTLRVGAATAERLALFEPRLPADARLPADVLAVGADELREGGQVAIADEVDGHRFRISATSFFQTRTDGAAALVDAVRRAGAGTWGRGHLVDLYGGVGLFAVCVGDAMRVTLVEAGRAAAADAAHNLAEREHHVVRARADKWRPEVADVVVADPPRSGLGATVAGRIAATGAGRVVLVSCDPASFARDTRLLVDAGYRLVDTVAVDLFPHTPHVELVTRFDLAPA